ncbi:MAG: hypothetical protein K6G83_04705 [Lachnospiraceae bacterium]|nr:hypothetical protein [Lachnospiraceae bacterium]
MKYTERNEKKEESAELYPVDAGGLTQFLTGIKEQTPVFLIEYRTKEPVDREKLRDAAEKALSIFRSFKMTLTLSEPAQIPAYMINSREVAVYPYDGEPHAFLTESNGYLFRVYYAENRILLSVDHMLSDFAGAHEFLKCILYFYFNVAEGDPADIRKKLLVDPDDLRSHLFLPRCVITQMCGKPASDGSGSWKRIPTKLPRFPSSKST